MCQVETHVVLNENEGEAYVNAATVYQHLDYNDFSVDAYVNPAANPGPKPVPRGPVKGKGKAKASKEKRKSRQPVGADDVYCSPEPQRDAQGGTSSPMGMNVPLVVTDAIASRPSPIASPSPAALDWSGVAVPSSTARAPSRGRGTSASQVRGSGRSASVASRGRGRGRAPERPSVGRASSQPPSCGITRPRGKSRADRALMSNYSACDLLGDMEEPPLQRQRRERPSDEDLARVELNRQSQRFESLEAAGIPVELTDSSSDERRETRSKSTNDQVYRQVFGDDDVVPGQERLPRDESTSDSSESFDEEGSDDEVDDADDDVDDMPDPAPMSLGNEVVTASPNRELSPAVDPPIESAAPERPQNPTTRQVGKGKYDAWLVKGVWKPEEEPEDNQEIKFFDFSEQPDSPKPDREEDDPLLPLGPKEDDEPSQSRVKLEVFAPPLGKDEKRAQKLQEKEARKAIKAQELARERMERERQDAARERQRLADLAAQNARVDRLESTIMNSQSETRLQLGKMEHMFLQFGNILSRLPMPVPIASFNPEEPRLSICEAVPAVPVAPPLPPPDSGLEVAPLPPVESGHSLEIPDDRNDAVDYEIDADMPAQEDVEGGGVSAAHHAGAQASDVRGEEDVPTRGGPDARIETAKTPPRTLEVSFFIPSFFEFVSLLVIAVALLFPAVLKFFAFSNLKAGAPCFTGDRQWWRRVG